MTGRTFLFWPLGVGLASLLLSGSHAEAGRATANVPALFGAGVNQSTVATPASILGSSLGLWYRSDVGTTLGGTGVASRATAGGVFGPYPLSQATPSKQPLYTPGPVGVALDGYDLTDQTDLVGGLTLNSEFPFEEIIICSTPTAGRYLTYIGMPPPGIDTGPGLFYQATGGGELSLVGDTVVATQTLPVGARFLVIDAVFTGGSASSLTINGTTTTASLSISIGPGTQLTIGGANGFPSDYSTFDVYEAIFTTWGTVASAQQKTEIAAYIRGIYGSPS